MDIKKFDHSEFKGTVKETAMLAQSLRNEGTDVSLEEVVHKKHGISLESYYQSLGVNPSVDSISNIFTVDDTNDLNWLVPEIYAAAMKLGLRRSPMWPSLIAAEQSISQTSIKMPIIQKADSDPRYVNEAETIAKGTITFDEKEVSIKKIGRGIEIPYEVTNYVSLDVVSLFFEDMGNQLGLALDVLAIDTLINGEQANGSESAPVVGVNVANTKTYRDLLRIWVRMARLGRKATTIIGGEDAALDTLDLAEFKSNNFGGVGAAGVPTSTALDFKTPIPAKSNYWVHGNVPANQEIILDPAAALIKFNAQPLMIESEKVVSNQTNAFYATLTTGFAKLFTDSAVIMDKSLLFSGNGFPAQMDPAVQENVIIK
tara:strand:- start:614 stop:1729 length:1116 start_codon:yes stop_codon:yes gene_type:complete